MASSAGTGPRFSEPNNSAIRENLSRSLMECAEQNIPPSALNPVVAMDLARLARRNLHALIAHTASSLNTVNC